MIKRSAWWMGVLALVLVWALMLLDPGLPVAREQKVQSKGAAIDRAAEVPAPVSRDDLQVSRSGPLVVLDALTGQQLDLSIELLAEETRVPLDSGNLVDLSRFSEDLFLEYALEHSAETYQCNLGQSREWSGESWILTIPYFSSVDVEIRGLPTDLLLEDSMVRIYPDPRTLVEDSIALGGRGPFDLDYVNMTLPGLTRWLLRGERLPALAEVGYSTEVETSLLVAGVGVHVLGWIHPKGPSCFVDFSLVPGTRIEVVLTYHRRPLLSGLLVDWNDTPVPGAKVTLTTALNLQDYDLSPGDSHGLVVYRREGRLYHTARKSRRTDAEGRFSFRVPSGTDYAVESHALGGYVFWSTQDSDVQPSLDMNVVLQLLEPVDESMLTVTFRNEDGTPITDGKVNVAVPGDIPFFRQWPEKQPLGENGQVKLTGFEPGAEIAIFLFHESLNGTMHVPPYQVVPSFREIDIFVPQSAYRKTEQGD